MHQIKTKLLKCNFYCLCYITHNPKVTVVMTICKNACNLRNCCFCKRIYCRLHTCDLIHNLDICPITNHQGYANPKISFNVFRYPTCQYHHSPCIRSECYLSILQIVINRLQGEELFLTAVGLLIILTSYKDTNI
jgi:hypothetical protein